MSGERTTNHETVDAFNAACPIGTPVLAFPGSRDGRALMTTTRSTAWLVGVEPVVMVEGYAGGIALTHVEVLPSESAPDPTADERSCPQHPHWSGMSYDCAFCPATPDADDASEPLTEAEQETIAALRHEIGRPLWESPDERSIPALLAGIGQVLERIARDDAAGAGGAG